MIRYWASLSDLCFKTKSLKSQNKSLIGRNSGKVTGKKKIHSGCEYVL